MLEYLVTSRARRELLNLLWLEGDEASGRALANKAGVSRSLADRELKAMTKAGLAQSRVKGAATLYRAAERHPDADLLRALLASEPVRTNEEEDRETRSMLASLGAPLVTDRPARGRPSLTRSVSRGLELAHRDPSVARALPVLLARRASDLDLAQLEQRATERGERQTLGFFVDLTATLAGDRRFAQFANRLRDHRRSRSTYFFARPASRFERELVERNTPDVARRWHYKMNMPMDDFRAFFAKHS